MTVVAGRIDVNDAVRPETGGFLWRIRDGSGAVAEGPASDACQPNAFVNMCSGTAQSFRPGGRAWRQRHDHAVRRRVSSPTSNRPASLRSSGRRRSLASAASLEAVRSGISGVSIDDELQRLVEIEQAFAANSQVIRSLSEMLDTLLAAF
jgi:flagellar hook-associated protein 1 FlgK